MTKLRPSDVYFGTTEVGQLSSRCDDEQVAAEGFQGRHEFAPDRFGEEDFARRATAGLDVVAALAACDRVDPDETLFFGWELRLHRTLLPAYVLYLVLVAGGEDAVAEALTHPELKERRRGPRRRNLALLAVLIVAKPRDEPQRKLCSDYATLLTWAAMNRVEPKDFAERMPQVTLDRCKKEVRQKRAAHKRGATGPTEANKNDSDMVRAADGAGSSPPAAALRPPSRDVARRGLEIPNAELALADAGLRSSPKCQLVVTSYDESGEVAVFTTGIAAESCKALRQFLDQGASFTDAADLFHALEMVVCRKRFPKTINIKRLWPRPTPA